MKSKKLILLLATLSIGIGVTAFSACNFGQGGGSSSSPATSSSAAESSSADSSSPSVTKYSVTTNACEGVTVLCDKEIEKNGTLQFTVELSSAYEGELTITATVGGAKAEVLSGIGGFYSVSGVTGNVVITITGATLKVNTYQVTYNACDGVIVDGEKTIAENGALQFTVSLGNAYEGELTITATVGGEAVSVSKGENGVCTIENVTGNVIITITGARLPAKKHNVTFSTVDDGLVMPADAIAEEGTPFAFEIALKDGYEKKDFWVKANGQDVPYDETQGKYVVENVTSYLEITAGGTEIIEYTLDFSCEVEEALSVESKKYGYFDANVVFSVPLAEHYTQSVLVVSYTAGENSGTLTADAEGYYTLPNQKADVTITVSGVALNHYTVSFFLNGESKHSVSAEALSVLTEEQLNEAAAAVVANSEYSFVKWAEDVSGKIVQDVDFNAEVIWGETVAENAIRSTTYVTAAKDETEEVPAGYTTVYKGVWGKDKNEALQTFSKYGFADINVSEYSKLKFAIKGNTHIFNDGWAISYALTNGWLEVSLEKTEGLTWNLTFTQGGNPETSKSDTVKGETLSAILGSFSTSAISGLDITAYEMYATDIRGVKDPDYSATLVDTKLGLVVDGLEPTQDVAAPVGYESVYDVGVLNGHWSDASVENYTKFRFKIMTNGWQLYEGWTVYEASKLYAWLEVSAEKTADGWAVKIMDVDDVRYEKTLSGASLKSIFAKYATGTVDNELVVHTYVTELRGEKAPVWEGELITGAGIDGFAESTDKTAPEGFDKAYYKESAGSVDFTETDISDYEEIRFYMALTDGCFLIDGWTVYAQNAEWGKDWHLVTLVSDGENNWTITVNAECKGLSVQDTTKHTYTSSGGTLKEVFAKWFKSYDNGNPNVYITEIRGIKADA